MAKIKAFIFDQDGVIIDTEKDGHRIAFNETFKAFGYDFAWDEDEYHELLQISAKGFGVEVKPEDEDELIKTMHKHKTESFIALLEGGKLPLRAGIKRLMQEINSEGLILGVCTTSNQRSAHTVAFQILKDIKFDFVLAGDVVAKKKPDTEIYNLALSESDLKPEECIVIEDSRNGVIAAHEAGMHIVATTNYYTAREDLHEANIIVTSLGDPGGEKGELIAGGEGLEYDGVLHARQLFEYFSR
jgi:HAD superfamily hydrolase (TIGR01509 family)